MSNTPYKFIETEDEQDGSTADRASLEELYPNYPDGPPPEIPMEEPEFRIEDIEIHADELAEELAAEEGDDQNEFTGVGSCVVNSGSSPTLLESVIQFLKGLVR